MPRQHRYGALTRATSVPVLCGVIEPFIGESGACVEEKKPVQGFPVYGEIM